MNQWLKAGLICFIWTLLGVLSYEIPKEAIPCMITGLMTTAIITRS
jgi:hypothetical protein